MNAIAARLCKKFVAGTFLSVLASSGLAAEKQCAAHFIQLFATSVPAKANTMKITLNQAGFKAAITSFKHNEKTLYRVRTGPYKSKVAAAERQGKLKAALKDNASAQNSILATGTAACGDVFPTAKPESTVLQGVAQCYYVKGTQSYEGDVSSYVSAIQFTEQQGKINGYYFYRPEGRDGAYGAITGTRLNNQITGQRHYSVEGDTGTDDISYQLDNNTLTDGSERYNKVSCASVEAFIDVAKGVSKDR